ncbi:hypothetical protein OG579_19090 [Williamsia herbipolensis]|uniref:RelA/SpoT domain-containing protein n=1 Tax=Williamsia herbipolensis TaxID=1603258 RepID=A0AAU4K130_9NOCA|nr:hypothetical protein [Williamsia herbipolensis]
MTEPSAHEQARLRYIQERPRFVVAEQKLRHALTSLVAEHGVAHTRIKVRTKEIGSFVKKIRKYGDDCWEKTTDKVGAQITVQTLADVRQIVAVLEASPLDLIHLATDAKSPYTGDPRKLQYSGVHVQVGLADTTTSDGESIQCEIQIRTQAQDVWSHLEHGLIYKPVLDPSPAIARKIARLSVLVEMFDEEVDDAMNELIADPRYRNALFLREAERWYLTFSPEFGERDLSMHVLNQIEAALADVETGTYTEVLRAFVEAHRDQIAHALTDYGPGSEYEKDFTYFLFTQPEALIVWERLESHRLTVAASVRGTELESAVAALADVWGDPLPTV